MASADRIYDKLMRAMKKELLGFMKGHQAAAVVCNEKRRNDLSVFAQNYKSDIKKLVGLLNTDCPIQTSKYITEIMLKIRAYDSCLFKIQEYMENNEEIDDMEDEGE